MDDDSMDSWHVRLSGHLLDNKAMCSYVFYIFYRDTNFHPKCLRPTISHSAICNAKYAEG